MPEHPLAPISRLARSLFRLLDQSQALYNRREIELNDASIKSLLSHNHRRMKTFSTRPGVAAQLNRFVGGLPE